MEFRSQHIPAIDDFRNEDFNRLFENLFNIKLTFSKLRKKETKSERKEEK